MARVTRKIITIDEERCDGCGCCVPSCAEGALQIVNGKARLMEESYCDGLGAYLGECPTGALRIVELEAEAYDEAAVAAHLEQTAPERWDQHLARLRSQSPDTPPFTAAQSMPACPSANVLRLEEEMESLPASTLRATL